MQNALDQRKLTSQSFQKFNIAFGADAPSAARAQVTDTYVFDNGATACFAGGGDQLEEHKAIPKSESRAIRKRETY